MRGISLGLILIIPLFIFSQDDESCNGLKYGSFELYENGKKIGNIFRKDNLQIEKYFDKDTYTFVKIKPSNCEFYFNAYEVKNELDTITWFVSYKKIKKDHYSFIGKPVYLNIDYVYQGELVKIADEIIEEVEEIFIKMK
jgi:hypothetical protein